LRHDVGRDVLPVEPLAERQPDRDRGVEVAARDVADGVGHRQHRQAEGQGDAVEADLGPGIDRRATSTEHQPEGPEELSRDAPVEWVHDSFLSSPKKSCRDRVRVTPWGEASPRRAVCPGPPYSHPVGSTEDASGVARLLAQCRAELDRVTPDRLAAELADGALVVDTRPVEQRERDGALPGAI